MKRIFIREHDDAYEATLQGGTIVSRSTDLEKVVSYIRSEWPNAKILKTNATGGYTEITGDADSGQDTC